MVNEVFNHTECQMLSAGVSQVNVDDLPRIRGARLVTDNGTQQVPAGPVKTSATVEQHKPGSQIPSSNELFVAVSRGRQASAGYRLELKRAAAQGRTVMLDYLWQAPPPGSTQAQVITSPCSVAQLTYERGVEAVAVTLNGQPFATLELRHI